MPTINDVKRFFAGQTVLSAAELDALVSFLRALRNNFTVAPPLEIRADEASVNISINGELLPPRPDVDSVVFYDAATKSIVWIPTTDSCTTTTPASTTTT